MNLPSPVASAFARLLAWDAPFLPAVTGVVARSEGVSIDCDDSGAPLRTTIAWPRARRLALATQLVAAVEFLFERGWYVGKSEVWAARVVRSDVGDLLRLGAPPRLRLDDPRLERRLRARPALRGDARAAVLAPLLRALVPERWSALETALDEGVPWTLGERLVAVLTGDGKTAGSLRHPLGPGRALWARQYEVPDTGVLYVEEEHSVRGAVAAAGVAAAAAGRNVEVTSGACDEAQIARALARAAADGRDAVVLTTLPAAGAAPLAVAGGEAGVWALGVGGALTRRHVSNAVERAAGRALLVGEALRCGAAAAFSGEPPAEITPARAEQLASPAARNALRWLGQSPVGLDAAELAALDGGDGAGALAELDRLRLVAGHEGRWLALTPGAEPDPARLAALVDRLPARSWAWCAATGMAAGDWGPLEESCEQALAAGESGTVLLAAAALPRSPRLRAAGAEAALAKGRLAEAERFLDAVPGPERDGRWHALGAWWAEQAGLPARAREELRLAAREALPDRLAARASMVAAELAHRDGDVGVERQCLQEAVARCPHGVPEARLLVALTAGDGALRRLWRTEADGWPADVRARALHLLGYAAMSRGSLAAAGTAMRAALRSASGANPRVLGEIHSDLGTVAILAEQLAVAERHLQLADRFLERCGSRRAVTVVRYNRGVVANDRLDWRAARELIVASRELRGGVADCAFWFEELELARCQLARGDLASARAMLPALQEGLERFAEHEVLHEALASVRGHAALADGDLEAAAEAAADAAASEKALLLAVARADAGDDPEPSLPPRWGVTITSRALARWRRGERDGARAAMTAGLARTPREAAVGLVRLAALLRRCGETLDESWLELRRRAEQILAESGLDGWATRLRSLLGIDVPLLLEAMGEIAAAGPDSLRAGHLETLARPLGLDGLEVRRGGAVLARWGDDATCRAAAAGGAVEVMIAGALEEPARAAAEVLATLAASSAAPRPEAAAGASASILGESSVASTLRAEVSRWAPLPVTVLVLGEPGTGKELVARELHRSSGRKGAFVAVNCAGIPATLLEAELFGVVKGAYTGADRDRPGLVESAERGTLFLDEIGELPLELQAKLLRLLQEKEVRRVGATASRAVDVRFLAATNRDLKAAVAAGGFRQDLYYRVSVAVIAIPPLRERPEDIEELARHFLAQYAAAFDRPGVRLAPAALAALHGGRWPGNVRELDSAIARAVATARPGEVIGAEAFVDVEPATGSTSAVLPWTAAVEAFRRGYFAAVLRATGGNRSEAARRAGLSRQALLYHLRHLGKLD